MRESGVADVVYRPRDRRQRAPALTRRKRHSRSGSDTGSTRPSLLPGIVRWQLKQEAASPATVPEVDRGKATAKSLFSLHACRSTARRFAPLVKDVGQEL